VTRSRPSAALLLALAASLPLPARAAGPAASARSLARDKTTEGDDLLRAGRYADAGRRFLAAEEALLTAEVEVPPDLYRLLARCYDLQGQPAAAMRYYARYLGLVDASSKDAREHVKLAREALVRLRARLEQTSLRFDVSPDGTEVRVDRRVIGTTPLDPLTVTPGPHQVTLWAEGHQPASLDLEVAAGTSVPVVVTLVPEAPPGPGTAAAEPQESSGGALLWWVGAGAAVLAAGTVVGVVLLMQEPEPDTYGVPAPVVVAR